MSAFMPDWARAAARRDLAAPRAIAQIAPSNSTPAPQAGARQVGGTAATAGTATAPASGTATATAGAPAAGLPPCLDCGGLVFWRPRVRRFAFEWRCSCCEPPEAIGAVERVVVVEVDLFGDGSGAGNVARRVVVPADLVAGLFFVDDLGPRWDGFWRRVVDGDGGCERVPESVAVVQR